MAPCQSSCYMQRVGESLTLRLDGEEDDMVIGLLAQVAQLQVGVFGRRMANLVASAWTIGQAVSNGSGT